METVIGKVTSLSGKFILRRANQEDVELKVGDTVNKNDVVIGHEDNTDADVIVFGLDNNAEMSINSNDKIFFDESVLSQESLELETVIDEKDVQEVVVLAEESNTHKAKVPVLESEDLGAEFTEHNSAMTDVKSEVLDKAVETNIIENVL